MFLIAGNGCQVKHLNQQHSILVFQYVRNGFCIAHLAFRQSDGLDEFLKMAPDRFFMIHCLLVLLAMAAMRICCYFLLEQMSYHSNENGRARDIFKRSNNYPDSCIFASRLWMASSNISFPSLDSKTGILCFE